MKKMDASTLKLPPGNASGRSQMIDAWHWGDMRLIVEYHINQDAFVARFDTLIEGKQQNCWFTSNEVRYFGNMTARDFGWLCTPFAMKVFQEGRATEGHELGKPSKLFEA